MVLSTSIGLIPAINGTGALKYSFRVMGRIGMRTCYHLNGNISEIKASTAYPRIVFDCETKRTFFSKRMA